ncbi:hypothetical protein LX36DRAFT_702517 [Colletotrichum falcatum]|nr:hypothetical protein LX36DRAFT_702517 [Colletotrichum falcatum]
MEELDPFHVIFFGSVLVAGLMAVFHTAGWLFNHLPELLAVVKAAGSFHIPINTLVAVPFFHLFLVTPIIRHFVPKGAVVTHPEQPSPADLVPELSDEQRAAEARRTREVKKLARELGEAEQRELDAAEAAEANRISHKLIRQRLDRTEQQLVRYEPEANTIRELEARLAESQMKVAEAEKQIEKGKTLLEEEVNRSKLTVEEKDNKISRIREYMANIIQRSKEAIATRNTEIKSLERELDTAIRKDMSAAVQALLAEKDATIQFLTDAGIAVEKDRDEKVDYAETMYASLQKENDDLRRQLSHSAERTSGDNDAVRSLRDDLAGARAQVQAAEAVFCKKDKKIDDLENRLQKVTDEFKTAVTHANDQVGTLRAKLSAAEEKAVSGFTKENIEGLNRQLEELQRQVADAHPDRDSKMSQASAIHAEQQQCIESLRNDMNAACIENTHMRQEISRLQELLSQHAASDANSSAVEQRIAAMQRQHQTDLNEAKSMLDAKDGEVKHLQDSLAGTKTHVDGLQEEVSELQACVDEQDEHIDKVENKLRKALANEKKAIERFTELDSKRKKDASADLLKYNRLKVEYNKATQERDGLLAGNQSGETKKLGDQLAKALDLMVTRDLEIGQLKEQIEAMKNKTGSKQAGAKASNERQNEPKPNRQQAQIYTTETRRKQQMALEIIERVQWAQGIRDDDEVEDKARPGDEMETDTAGGEEREETGEADESNREYSERTTAVFSPAIQASGVTNSFVANPFATPSAAPATAQNFSIMFGRLGPITAVGGETAASPEKPETPESATERHLSGATFWVPTKTPAATPTPQQQQQQQNSNGQETPDTPAPTVGRKLKKPSARRLQHAKKKQGDL